MKISLSLLESDSDIRKMILDEIIQTLQKALSSAARVLPDRIKNIVKDALKSEPEYQSLMSGNLRLEFGIADVSNVDLVINKLVDTLSLNIDTLKRSNNGVRGGITITMMKSDDFNGVISDESASVQDANKGYSLPWLEWLLLRGNQIIVRKYNVSFGSYPTSRSGGAVMVESNSSWRVPPEFAGTQSNNWTTRAIEKIEQNIINTLRSSIEDNL